MGIIRIDRYPLPVYPVGSNEFTPKQYPWITDQSLILNFQDNWAMSSGVFGPVANVVETSRASTGTYFDANGIIQIAPNNVWRQDHDPATGESLGVLIEEQRTNLVPQSGAVGDMSKGWGLNNVTAVVNAAVAPNGLTEATLITATADNAEARPRRDGVSIPINTDLTVSVFVKKTAASKDNLRFFLLLDVGAGGVFNYGVGEFNITTLQADPNGTGTTSAGIVDVGNGWLRCWFTVAGASNIRASTTLYLNLVDVAGSNRAAVGQELLYWGAQVEAGAFPTSYIPTTTAAATRAADFLVIANGWSQDWVNSSSGTIAAEFRTNENPPSGSSTSGPSIIGQTGTGGMYMHIQGLSPYRVRAGYLGPGGASAFANNQPNAGVISFARAAEAYGSGEVVIAVNGSVETFSTAVGDLVKTGDFRIGYRAAINPLNGHIKRIQYFPRRLSNAELQSATVLS